MCIYLTVNHTALNLLSKLVSFAANTLLLRWTAPSFQGVLQWCVVKKLGGHYTQQSMFATVAVFGCEVVAGKECHMNMYPFLCGVQVMVMVELLSNVILFTAREGVRAAAVRTDCRTEKGMWCGPLRGIAVDK